MNSSINDKKESPSSTSSSSSSSSSSIPLDRMDESALLQMHKKYEEMLRQVKNALENIKIKRDIDERAAELEERGWTWSATALRKKHPAFEKADSFCFDVYAKFSCSRQDSNLSNKNKWRFCKMDDENGENEWLDFLGIQSELENSDEVCHSDNWDIVDTQPENKPGDDDYDYPIGYDTFGSLTIYIYQTPVKMPLNRRFKIMQPDNGLVYDAMYDGKHLIQSRNDKGHVKVDYDDNDPDKETYFICLLD